MSFSDEDQQNQITQLQQQQAIFTTMMQRAVEGKWTGEDSVEAWLYALNPNLTGNVTADPPVTESEYENPKAG